jgi:hypothetical protein
VVRHDHFLAGFDRTQVARQLVLEFRNPDAPHGHI